MKLINNEKLSEAIVNKEYFTNIHYYFADAATTKKIMDGISTMVVNGHTEGQQLIKINGNGDSLVFCSDLIPLRSHLKLPWIMGYDLNAVLTLEEKTNFLKEAAKNNWWLWFYHDPKTIAVRIKKSEKYYDVVDGQQRLATLSVLVSHSSSSPIADQRAVCKEVNITFCIVP